MSTIRRRARSHSPNTKNASDDFRSPAEQVQQFRRSAGSNAEEGRIRAEVSHNVASQLRDRFCNAGAQQLKANITFDDSDFGNGEWHRPSLTAVAAAGGASKKLTAAPATTKSKGQYPRIFTGLLSAPITPFDPRTGRADVSIIRNEYAAMHRSDDIDGVFCCGTTGESMSLSSEERKAATEAWVSTGLQVCAHVSAQSLVETQKLARHAQDAGVHAIAVMCPSFFKPNTVDQYVEFLYEVYRAAPDVPMLIYHFPILTNIPFRLYDILIKAIPRIPTVRGAKFTSHDLSDYAACQAIGGQVTDMIYSIEGNMYAAAFMQCKAFVGMQFSMIAGVFRSIWEAASRGDVQRAKSENDKAVAFQLAMFNSCSAFSLEKAVALTKYLVGLRLGRDCGETRAPGARLTAEEKAKIEKTLLPFCAPLRSPAAFAAAASSSSRSHHHHRRQHRSHDSGLFQGFADDEFTAELPTSNKPYRLIM